MNDIRVNVASRIQVLNAIARDDILSASKTQDNIVRALDVITAPKNKPGYEKIGKGRKIIVTSAHSDHHDDGNLGPHGHNPHGAPGWAVDFVPQEDPQLKVAANTLAVIAELIEGNYYVTKVGCPGVYAANSTLQAKASKCGVALFTDEGTGPHIHIQSAEDFILSALAKNKA